MNAQKIVEEEVPSESETEGTHACEGIACDELEKWIITNKVTDQQAEALRKVRERWDMMETPQMDTINDCVMVAVGAGTNPMWLGIEKDGYTHS